VEAQPNVGFIGLGVMGHVRRLLTTAPSVWVRNVGSCGKVVFVDEAIFAG
jgi:3-hydroxyisobutyrate dehydrogenase-like beta-hydroxyacid dehydrogenase